MKIIATVTIIGKDRKSLPPGSEIDLPNGDAQSLIERGFALPSGIVKARKVKSPVEDSQETAGDNDPDDEKPSLTGESGS